MQNSIQRKPNTCNMQATNLIQLPKNMTLDYLRNIYKPLDVNN